MRRPMMQTIAGIFLVVAGALTVSGAARSQPFLLTDGRSSGSARTAASCVSRRGRHSPPDDDARAALW